MATGAQLRHLRIAQNAEMYHVLAIPQPILDWVFRGDEGFRR